MTYPLVVVLAEAFAHGISFTIDGPMLNVTSSVKPPQELLDVLHDHRHEIAAAIRDTPDQPELDHICHNHETHKEIY